MHSPNLRHLEIFRTLVQTLSVTRTGEMLNISQPAVSKAIAQLQETVGLELFQRVRGRLQPSEDALRLLAETEKLLNQVSIFRDEIVALQEARHGQLQLAAIHALAVGAIARSVGLFIATHPKVQVKFQAEMSARIIEAVEQHEIELGFIHGDPQNLNLRTNPIAESEFVCQIHGDHPLAAKKEITPVDLKGEQLILLNPSAPPAHLIRETFAEERVHPHVVAEINASHFAGEIVANAGIALVDPITQSMNRSYNYVLRRFRPRIPLRVYSISSANKPLSQVSRVFLEIAEREVRDAIRASLELVY